MLGLMQRHELLISSILEHAARHHGDAEVVSRRSDGALARRSYAQISLRARKLASVLADLGVVAGDRVGTLAMNSDRHLELYYAISGIGAICNTINPRLTPDDIAYIADHAGDEIIFCDPQFLPIIRTIAPKLARLRAVIVLGDADKVWSLDHPNYVAVHNYEALLTKAEPTASWPRIDEVSASGLCYTSGTTGRPKGVLYSHRSCLLNAMACNLADVVGLRATDRVAAVVPMFHVNAWGLPYMAPMTGASLLLPGAQLDPVSLLTLLNEERATIAVGVPTVWLNLLNHIRAVGAKLETLKRIMIGGAAMPPALLQGYADLGVRLFQGWGMTESSPVVTLNAPKPACLQLQGEAQLKRRCAQGRVVFGSDVQATNDDEQEVPWDGKTPGNIVFRGHWIASSYFRAPPDTEKGEWFPTGDVGVIDEDGFLTLTDRAKDLIKSGGEWISSIAIENVAVAHPDVAQAAAIAVSDEKWGERPLLIAVPKPGRTLDPEALRNFCRGKMADWSIPDRVVIAESIPYGATGKVLKAELRRIYSPPAV